MTSNRLIALVGSGRSVGDTHKWTSSVLESVATDVPLIDLSPLLISSYKYDEPSQDYISLIENVLQYDGWLLSTPVYWYMMSSIMHIFFERFQDLTSVRKDLGRRLKGKKIFVLAVFAGGYPVTFEDPFLHICQYMGMDYQGCTFFYTGNKNQEWLGNNAHHKQALVRTLDDFCRQEPVREYFAAL